MKGRKGIIYYFTENDLGSAKRGAMTETKGYRIRQHA